MMVAIGAIVTECSMRINMDKNYPTKIYPAILDLRQPTVLGLEDLRNKYTNWTDVELINLWYFRQLREEPDDYYTYAYCSHCQSDVFSGVPKAQIPFRLFVSACFTNYYILCDECQKKKDEKYWEKSITGVGLPLEFQSATFENWSTAEKWQYYLLGTAKHFCERYDRVPGLFLAGSTGTGKTRLAVTVMNELKSRKSDIGMKFARFSDLARLGRSRNNDIEQYINVELLCIDDIILAGIGYEWAQYVAPIIMNRYADRRSTIITTNIAHNEWLQSSDRYMQQIGDRLKDFMCRTTSGERSMRGEKK